MPGLFPRRPGGRLAGAEHKGVLGSDEVASDPERAGPGQGGRV